MNDDFETNTPSFYLRIKTSRGMIRECEKSNKVIAVATLPLGIASFPITFPLTVARVARKNMKDIILGDLSPVSDDET